MSLYSKQIKAVFADLKVGGANRIVPKHHSQARSEGNPGTSAAREKARAAKDTGAETYQEVVRRMLADSRASYRK